MRARLLALCWRAAQRLKRLGRAWRYATDRMTEDDADHMRYECQFRSGFYPLSVFTREAVFEQCSERWGAVPGMAAWVQPACERVYNKWNDDGEHHNAAETWAMDLVAEYAAQDGIKLIDREDA